MAREISSKNIDGIADLVVIAPIKEGFINAYENVTFATRLRIVAEALNRIRVSAREHEAVVPFSDVTERILTLVDFRIGVLDKDLFSLERPAGSDRFALQSRRYLYLTATFDTAWEPYMRLIWDPLGPFLDLIFCNCEGYVTAGDNSCEAFLDWVRDHQMDSAIFYATTGNTIRDDVYLGKVDRLLREVGHPQRELDIARTTMPDPEVEAGKVRREALQAYGNGDKAKLLRINELALEVLTVLFRLVDYYPPEWLFRAGVANTELALTEGKYLARVAYSILKGWDDAWLPPTATQFYKEPLEWYRTARQAAADGTAPRDLARPTAADPPFDRSQVPAGILTPLGTPERPVLQGALLLVTITDTDPARAWLRACLDAGQLHFEGDAAIPPDGFYRSVAFSAEGLKRIGLERYILDAFPKEFREGMAARSGLIGDVRTHHPRNWQPPQRNWPPGAAGYRPAVDINEIDIVIQLRHAPAGPADPAVLTAEVSRIAAAMAESGLLLVAHEPLQRLPGNGARGEFTDHFGFTDGVSQPDVQPAATDTMFATAEDGRPIWNNKARLGEVLLGYRNDRDDYAPPGDARADGGAKRAMRKLTHNGSFLVVRKLEQHVADFHTALERAAARLRDDGFAITAEEIAWQIVGRKRDGAPLVDGADGQNGFDYDADREGSKCPFAAHIRRTNPRDFTHGRPAPRIVRRGMSYGPAWQPGEATEPARGLMFMCYQSSIAEQFETIQRWINGGNSTGVSSAQNDPLLGVGPKQGPRLFQFEWQGRVARVEMPEDFVSLRWGLYLFSPSRSGLNTLAALRSDSDIEDNIPDMAEFLENTGRERINRIQQLPRTLARAEWKRLLEDLDAKDPAQLSLTPDVWSAIRWYQGGAYRLQYEAPVATIIRDIKSNPPTAMTGSWVTGAATDAETDAKTDDSVDVTYGLKARATVIVAGRRQVEYVLANWKIYSVEEQLRRLEGTSGAIYVSQQPDDRYVENTTLNDKYNYRQEAAATNAILMQHTLAHGFAAGHAIGNGLLQAAQARARGIGIDYYKLELRRQYIMPALGMVCSAWFGIPGPILGPDPDGLNAIMANGGWDWNTATDPADRDGASLRTARCPGDCLSPSRHAFYPRPTESIAAYAHDHGPAIRKAGERFIDQYFGTDETPPGSVTAAMFAAKIKPDVMKRNLIGIMMGAMPPMDGNLRGILIEWLSEATLWRHQAAYLRARENGKTPFDAAREALWIPMTRAMCKRPAPDLLYRIAIEDDVIEANGHHDAKDTIVRKGDMVIIAQVGASQRSLFQNPFAEGKVSSVFGGERKTALQGDYDGDKAPAGLPPVHGCPGQEMAMGAMLGIVAALFEAGRIQALPASLIVKIMDWPPQPMSPPG